MLTVERGVLCKGKWDCKGVWDVVGKFAEAESP